MMEENDITKKENENIKKTDQAASPSEAPNTGVRTPENQTVPVNRTAGAEKDSPSPQNDKSEAAVDEFSVEMDDSKADESFEANDQNDHFDEFVMPNAVDPTRNMDRLLDVEMNVTVRFGLTEVPLREAVSFGIGSMIELNRSVDEPVDLLVNNYPFARGEVVVIDGYYGVKITEIGSPEERSQTLLKNSNI